MKARKSCERPVGGNPRRAALDGERGVVRVGHGVRLRPDLGAQGIEDRPMSWPGPQRDRGRSRSKRIARFERLRCRAWLSKNSVVGEESNNGRQHEFTNADGFV